MDRKNDTTISLRKVKFYISWLIEDGIWESMPSDEEILKKLSQLKILF
jgi:hypothetical protein